MNFKKVAIALFIICNCFMMDNVYALFDDFFDDYKVKENQESLTCSDYKSKDTCDPDDLSVANTGCTWLKINMKCVSDKDVYLQDDGTYGPMSRYLCPNFSDKDTCEFHLSDYKCAWNDIEKSCQTKETYTCSDILIGSGGLPEYECSVVYPCSSIISSSGAFACTESKKSITTEEKDSIVEEAQKVIDAIEKASNCSIKSVSECASAELCTVSQGICVLDTSKTKSEIQQIIKENVEKADKVITLDGRVITPAVQNIIFWILTAVKYVGIIALIVLGILDFLKAAASGSEDETKKSRQKFVKRLIACIILFLMPYLVNLLLSLVNLTMSNYETKDINNNDTSTKPACESLGIQACSSRSDCVVNGSSSCKTK